MNYDYLVCFLYIQKKIKESDINNFHGLNKFLNRINTPELTNLQRRNPKRYSL